MVLPVYPFVVHARHLFTQALVTGQLIYNSSNNKNSTFLALGNISTEVKNNNNKNNNNNNQPCHDDDRDRKENTGVVAFP